MSPKKDIQALVEEKNREGLLAALRNPGDAGLRAQAARGLADLHETEAVESLIRSTLEDPDPVVRAAAGKALEEILGTQTAANAVAVFRSATPAGNEPWLVEPEAEDHEAPLITGAVEWERSDVAGLTAVLYNEHDPQLRRKAIRALAEVHDSQAINTLADTALWDEDPQVSAAAKSVLEEIYGSDLAEFLEAHQEAVAGVPLKETEGEDEYLSYQEDSNKLFSHLARRTSPFQTKNTSPPVIQEDNPARMLIPFLLLVLVAAAVILYLIAR